MPEQMPILTMRGTAMLLGWLQGALCGQDGARFALH